MSEPIRILHILQRMEAGGTQALLMNLYRNIDRTKVQFDFLVEYPNKYFYDDEILSLGGRIFYTNIRQDKNIVKFKKEVRKVLAEENYKIVHVHAYTIGYFVLKEAKKCGVKVRIAHSHNNQTVKDGKYILKLIMQKLFTIYATDLFACSADAGRYLFKGKKFHVLNNAIDSKKFIYNEVVRNEVRKELNVAPNTFLIGNVGRLHSQKNQMFLLDVFSKYLKKNPDSVLLIIGDGPLENDIVKKIDSLNIGKNVIMLKNRSDMDRIYQAMDIFVLPSLFEGLGIVAIEAQAAGVPVLASTGVSRDADLTDLINYMPLSDGEEKWAENLDEISKNTLAHTDMHESIIRAGYDLHSTVKFIENFYINKYYQ